MIFDEKFHLLLFWQPTQPQLTIDDPPNPN